MVDIDRNESLREMHTARMFDLEEHIDRLKRWAGRNDISGFFSQMCINDAALQIDKSTRVLNNIKKSLDNKSDITDAMIEEAREVKIESIIEFTRGKSVAFCHDDNNPSMFHAKRINKACCPVCNEYFDTIEVLIQRDGYSFISAVKQLCGGY